MLEATIIESRSDAIHVLIYFAAVIAVMIAYSIWGKYFSHGPYRGVRIVNWTRAQRDEARQRKSQIDAERSQEKVQHDQ